MLPVLLLTLLSWVAGMNADCSSADCSAVWLRSSSLLQVKVKRNQGVLDDASSAQDMLQTTTPDILLQTVQRIAQERLQALGLTNNESGDPGSNGSNDSDDSRWENPDTILEAIEGQLKLFLFPDIQSGRIQDQALLDQEYKKLLSCALKMSAEEEAAGVAQRHADHESCRQSQAIEYVDQRGKCNARDEYVEGLGEVPDSPNGNDFPTLVERWREYFARAVPLVSEKYTAFKNYDDACLAAVKVWEDRKKLCKSKQAAYEAVVCDTQKFRQTDATDCIAAQMPVYNNTIQLVAAREGDRIADYVSGMRILCYIQAMSTDEGFAEATHDCHAKVVPTDQIALSYPGWPASQTVVASRMYPCGKVWLSYAYGSLPFYGPHDDCTKCPNLPDLDGSASVFTRWGSLSCPDPSSLIYKGLVAGNRHDQHGNGANLVCLVETPSIPPNYNGGHENNAHLVGIQYRADYVGVNRGNGDAGCSRCSFNGAIYTNWATTECQKGHIEIYTGNVMSAHHSHWRNEFVCVDKERALHFKSNTGNNNQGLLYLVEYHSGLTHNSAFPNNYEVACVVCGIPDKVSDVYTRWGHDSCGDDASLVYAGAAAGPHYGWNGGGWNTLCLNLAWKPAPDTKNGQNNDHSMIENVEYEDTYTGAPANNNHDAGCAVCEYSGKTSYNVWGTRTCGDGHVRLYEGQVWGERHNHGRRNEWVCVDPARKGHAKQHTGSHDGMLWYLAEYTCGSLPCGPFHNNWEVACAVCGIPEDFGDVFTRWGHLDCPDKSTKIYSGVVGGAAHNHAGGGANPLCLSETPELPSQWRNADDNRAMLYGTEYKGYGATGMGGKDAWDAGCALCAYKGLASYESWGSRHCPDGYDKLYEGNVWAGHHGHRMSNYVCVDKALQGHFKNNKGGQGGAYWYMAEYECGSLPCDLFPSQMEPACAVCGIPSLEGPALTMRCSGWDTSESCPRGTCEWMGDVCKSACMMFRTNTSCPSECIWDEDQALCQEDCSDFKTLDVCPTGRCWWSDGLCTSFTDDTDADGFVRILKDFEYDGKTIPPLTEPRKYGDFDMLKAVYKSGPGVACDGATGSSRVWQRCSNGNDAKWSFEFKKNSAFVLEQANWHTLPSACQLPQENTGDIVCTVSFSLDTGDRVLASWYDPTHKSSTADNSGTIIVDIYGRRKRD